MEIVYCIVFICAFHSKTSTLDIGVLLVFQRYTSLVKKVHWKYGSNLLDYLLSSLLFIWKKKNNRIKSIKKKKEDKKLYKTIDVKALMLTENLVAYCLGKKDNCLKDNCKKKKICTHNHLPTCFFKLLLTKMLENGICLCSLIFQSIVTNMRPCLKSTSNFFNLYERLRYLIYWQSANCKLWLDSGTKNISLLATLQW